MHHLKLFAPVLLVGSLAVAAPSEATTRHSYPLDAVASGRPAYQVIYRFQSGNDGALPDASLFVDASGALYGTTLYGGPGIGSICNFIEYAGCGTVFKLTRTTTGYAESILHAFQPSEGGLPAGNVIVDKHGRVFGSTTEGGYTPCDLGCGNAFELKPSGSSYRYRSIHAFQGPPDGSAPFDGLIADVAGALYGTTGNGGISGNVCPQAGCGTAFRLTRAGSGYVETVLYDFKGGTTDGAFPAGNLLADTQGALFGTTAGGGSSASVCPQLQCGTVFRLRPAGKKYSERVIYFFQGKSDGAGPNGGLIADSSGALYGTTTYGGSASCNCGTVFKLTPKGVKYILSVLWMFGGGTDGAQPYAGLLAVNNGILYGTTEYGGDPQCFRHRKTGCGTVFQLIPSGSHYTERVVYRFQGGKDGALPVGALIASNNALFGTTAQGGGSSACFPSLPLGCGTVFELTP